MSYVVATILALGLGLAIPAAWTVFRHRVSAASAHRNTRRAAIKAAPRQADQPLAPTRHVRPVRMADPSN